MATVEELTKQNEDLQKKVEALVEKQSNSDSSLDEIKQAKADLVEQRDKLKKELASEKDKKQTDNSTVEQLKELLAESKKDNEAIEAARKADKALSKLETIAKKLGFVTNKDGNVNMKLLESQIDVSALHIDDDGDLIGAQHKLEKLKESDPYFFNKKDAPGKDPKIDPKNVKGEDLSMEAFNKKSFADQVKHMTKLGKIKVEADKDSGLPPGMSMASSVDNKAGEGSEPANPAE